MGDTEQIEWISTQKNAKVYHLVHHHIIRMARRQREREEGWEGRKEGTKERIEEEGRNRKLRFLP